MGICKPIFIFSTFEDYTTSQFDCTWCPNLHQACLLLRLMRATEAPWGGAIGFIEGPSLQIVFLEFGNRVRSSCAGYNIMRPSEDAACPCEFGHNYFVGP